MRCSALLSVWVLLAGRFAWAAVGEAGPRYDPQLARAYFSHQSPLPPGGTRTATFVDSAGTVVSVQSPGGDMLDDLVSGSLGDLYDEECRGLVWQRVCRELVMQPLPTTGDPASGLLASVRAELDAEPGAAGLVSLVARSAQLMPHAGCCGSAEPGGADEGLAAAASAWDAGPGRAACSAYLDTHAALSAALRAIADREHVADLAAAGALLNALALDQAWSRACCLAALAEGRSQDEALTAAALTVRAEVAAMRSIDWHTYLELLQTDATDLVPAMSGGDAARLAGRFSAALGLPDAHAGAVCALPALFPLGGIRRLPEQRQALAQACLFATAYDLLRGELSAAALASGTDDVWIQRAIDLESLGRYALVGYAGTMVEVLEPRGPDEVADGLPQPQGAPRQQQLGASYAEGLASALVALSEASDHHRALIAAATTASPVGSSGLSAPGGLRDPTVELVLIPAGEAVFGSTATERGSESDQRPQFRLDLPAYCIGKTEITNAQYQRFVLSTGHPAPTLWAGGQIPPGLESHPVVCVSWEDARSYCDWAGVRLPTELEWEKAARGTKGSTYPWGDRWDASRCQNTDSRGRSDTAPVGAYPTGVSPYGLQDMAGNAWEWCEDWYDPAAYSRYALGTYAPPKSGACRVLRGGGWNFPGNSRCALRSYGGPTGRYIDAGFRVALSP